VLSLPGEISQFIKLFSVGRKKKISYHFTRYNTMCSNTPDERKGVRAVREKDTDYISGAGRKA